VPGRAGRRAEGRRRRERGGDEDPFPARAGAGGQALSTTGADYDPRYLAGVLFFNRGDYFEAHEVWEDLWADTPGPEQRFYQGLIQAAVALHHFAFANLRGAAKLFRTSRAYMEPYGSPYLGLDAAAFWRQMERCFAEVLARDEPDRSLKLDESLAPTITLDPPPGSWPDPEEYLGEDE
jgi:predicted metal-dependent hydrolase